MVDEMVTDLKKNINKEEIDRLPLFVFTGEVIVIEDPEHAAQAARFLRENSFVGFDTETRPAFHKGERYKVGLLQLATRDQVYLFRLNKCGFGKELRDLLSDPVVVKIGVGIRDDLRNLRKSGEVTPASFVDMQEYAARFGIEDKSFSKLMAIIFGVRISKKQRVSNWEALVLTEAQIRYAATDAWGALKMYERLSSEA
mgnify:CR=1 FL=1